MLTLKEFKEARGVLSGRDLQHQSSLQSRLFQGLPATRFISSRRICRSPGPTRSAARTIRSSTLSDEEKARGLVTASAGNHAQGVAYAAQAAGVSATIVMPTTTPLVKVNNTKDYGAKVVLHGETFDDAAELAAKLSEEEGLTYVHPFNDPAIATGQGTISYEIPDIPARRGCDSGAHRRRRTGHRRVHPGQALNPNVTVIGVEPSGAASMKASLDAGHVVTLDRVETIADGVAVKTPGDQIFPYIQKNIDDIITIPDDELVDAFLDMMEKHKMIVENAGLLPIAALSHLKCRGKNVVPVLSGGNMDVITVASLVQHGLINRGRVFTFSVQLPDRPGELLRVALSRGGGQRQHHQAGAQPVRQYQPPVRRGAPRHPGGLRPHPQAGHSGRPVRRGLCGPGVPHQRLLPLSPAGAACAGTTGVSGGTLPPDTPI